MKGSNLMLVCLLLLVIFHTKNELPEATGAAPPKKKTHLAAGPGLDRGHGANPREGHFELRPGARRKPQKANTHGVLRQAASHRAEFEVRPTKVSLPACANACTNDLVCCVYVYVSRQTSKESKAKRSKAEQSKASDTQTP